MNDRSAASESPKSPNGDDAWLQQSSKRQAILDPGEVRQVHQDLHGSLRLTTKAQRIAGAGWPLARPEHSDD
jgi:hypothetical protein